MFAKHHRKGANPIFIIFRLILSLGMFLFLLFGAYSAYKHFSGVDPLKLDPQSVFKNVLGAKTPDQLIKVIEQTQKNTAVLSLTKSPPPNVSTKYIFRFLLLTDSHSDGANLKRVITQAKSAYPDIAFIIGLGDYTEVGTAEELNKAKLELDSSSLRYFLIPGDHDLWDSRNKQEDPITNFKAVFGPSFQSFTYAHYRLILLNNSDNYTGISEEQLNWLTDELQKAKNEGSKLLVFVHEPLYHPSSDHIMGRVEAKLKSQAKGLVYQLKAADVKMVFAGDAHYFSQYEEPETKLPMVTVGAIVAERNPQAPRFAIVYVFDDGSIKVEDVEIK